MSQVLSVLQNSFNYFWEKPDLSPELKPVAPRPIGHSLIPQKTSLPPSDHWSAIFNALQAGTQKVESSFGFLDKTTPKLALPPRRSDALSGSEFWQSVKDLSRSEREAAIQREISLGNVPEHLRELQEIELKAKSPTGETLKASAHVTPDYLAIGSSNDYVLVPMSPITAQAIADQTQTTLPTRKLVNAIYQQAEIKLSPRPQKPGPQMMSTPYYERHDNTIRQQRQRAGAQNGDLIAGHKKDVVITNRLDRKPKSVAIYGWHQRNGKNIQPLSTLHVNTYADYSHGVRLVGPSIEINGQSYATQDVLKNPEFAALLSDEGVIHDPRATR